MSQNTRYISIAILFLILGAGIFITFSLYKQVTNGTRAYIAGEAQWTKAQKQSHLALIRFILEEDEKYFSEFEQHLQVNEGDRLARETLLSDNPDYDLARTGFLQGKNAPETVSEMIWLFHYISNVEPMKFAIDTWTTADKKIDDLRQIATAIHTDMLNNQLTDERKESYIDTLYQFDDEFTRLETQFSYHVTEASNKIGTLLFRAGLLFLTLLLLALAIVIIRLLKKSYESEQQRSETESMLTNVLNNSRDLIYQFNTEKDRYVYVSPSVKTLFGFTREEVIEGGADFIFQRVHPEDQIRIKEEFEKLHHSDVEKALTHDTEFRVRHKNGHYVWINNQRGLLKDKNGDPKGIIGNVRDISDRKKIDNALRKSLKEKEVLLAEIHHRIKNNLSIISSIVELQKATADDGDVSGFNEIQSRIKSIAIIHEKLYQTDSFDDVNMPEYLEELTNFIFDTYNSSEKSLEVEYNLQPLSLNLTKAVPVGLFSNEVINNVYKHAFPNEKKGMMKIDLEVNNNDNITKLSISDNGVGLPDDFDIHKQESLGMNLLVALSRQLDAELTIESDEWTRFTIEFETGE